MLTILSYVMTYVCVCVCVCVFMCVCEHTTAIIKYIVNNYINLIHY